jgi:hypothetical protein
VFDDLTIVDAGFAIQPGQCLDILGIAIGCNDDPGRRRWQLQSGKHQVKSKSTGGLCPLSPEMSQKEP